MDKENSDDSLSPPEKILRKKWKYDPDEPIPRSTLYRWQKLERLNKDRDNTTNIELSETVSNEPHSDVCSPISISDEDSEFSDSNIEDENDVSDNSADEGSSDVSEINDFDFSIGNTTEDSADDHSTNNLEPENVSTISSLVQMLYDDTDISVTQAVLVILNYYVRHRLSKTALQDLSTIVHDLLPKDNKMPTTLHQLFTFVEDTASSYRVYKHYYCRKCLFYYGTEVDAATCPSCTSAVGTSYFFEMDLADLIKYMFEKRDLASKLHVPKHQQNIISDITDGSEYIRVNQRPDRNEFDLTLILNTDGISLVKSSKSHCWPSIFMIMELPEYLRESFIGILGLWYDTKEKPKMNTFLRPFCQKLKTYFNEGIKWTHPSTQEVHVSKIVAPLFIADAPARAEILNIAYFTGKYGCNICEVKTKRCKREQGKKRAVRAYVFTGKNNKLRSFDRMEQQAQFALMNNLPNKRGVKGILSIISEIPFLDLGTCVLPEYMHSVLLGVGKQFFHLWLNKKGAWNVSKNIEKIDEMLLNIHPPSFFNRMPRSLTNLSHYKASEFYNLILFYSIPIFNNQLPDEYLQHWILFVVAIFNLLKKTIEVKTDLKQTEMLLRIFVTDISKLYGKTQYTYNVHQLLHLTLCVERWGPLWSNSAFPFENVNGILSACIHGSKHFGQEMVNKLKIMQGWQNLRAITAPHQHLPVCANLRKFETLDEIKMQKLNNDELTAFIQLLSADSENVNCFLRCRIGNDDYTSETYKRTKTNSYTIEIDTNNELIYGAIQIFININTELGFILKPFDIKSHQLFRHYETDTVVSHILPMSEKSGYLYFKEKDIKCMSHVIRIADYICKRPNKLNKVM